MISRSVLIFAAAITGFTVAALAVGGHTRQLEKKQHKEDLRAWEDEGGNLAPSETAAAARAVAAA